MASLAHRSTRIAGVLALIAAAVLTTGVPAFGDLTKPRFVVVVQPLAARPGEPVTVTLRPLDSRYTIVDCLVAFTSQAGGRCRRSSGRWSAETTVPPDARPGSAVLRWGIAARDADGRAAADNGSIEYEVLPFGSSSSSHPPPASASRHLVAAQVVPHPPSARPGDSAPAVAAVWGRRLQVLGGTVLGAVLLALPLAFGGIRARIRRRWRRRRPTQQNRPEDVKSGHPVDVTPIAYIGRSAVAVRDHDRWPVRLVWTLPPIEPRLEEYP